MKKTITFERRDDGRWTMYHGTEETAETLIYSAWPQYLDQVELISRFTQNAIYQIFKFCEEAFQKNLS